MQKTVSIPDRTEHAGLFQISVVLDWHCPECGGERGPVTTVRSYDGSRWMNCDGWKNPCGHVDKYSDVRREAASNGLNLARA